MTGVDGYLCTCCGQRHDGLPFAYGAPAPVYWSDELAQDGVSVLGEEQCEIKGENFFVRARIVIRVLDADQKFVWGVWISLSQKNYARMSEMWDDPRRVDEPPYFGWLSTELPCYPEPTLNLRTNLHHEPVGTRPHLELEPTDHPLAVEQRDGITLARVQEIAEQILHPGGPTP